MIEHAFSLLSDKQTSVNHGEKILNDCWEMGAMPEDLNDIIARLEKAKFDGRFDEFIAQQANLAIASSKLNNVTIVAVQAAVRRRFNAFMAIRTIAGP